MNKPNTLVADKTVSQAKITKDKLGIALLGLGEYSTDQLAPALQETSECYLAGLVSDEQEKLDEWKKKFNIPDKNIYTYQNFDSIKDNADIDVVYIVLPNSMHPEYAMRAAKSGKHVICEKPMAITVEECDKMIKVCREANKTLSIGYRLHFEPYNLKMEELGTKKVYGKIKKIIAQNGIDDIDGWRLDKKLAGGGALMDVGIYCIQAVRYTTGMEPLAVKASEDPKTDPVKFKEVEESVTWYMKMPGDIIAECKCSYRKKMDFLRVEAEKGWFELSPAFAYNDIKGKTIDGVMHLENVNQQVEEMNAISLDIKNKRNADVSGEKGRQDVKILQAIYASLKTGDWVEID
jgi:predicted dehydrogenase